MVKLFLIQHGEAKTKDEDPAKPLTEHGAAVVETMAAWAARAGVQVSEIRHSGKRRAEQTADIFGRHLPPDRGVVAANGSEPQGRRRAAGTRARQPAGVPGDGRPPAVSRSPSQPARGW